MTPAPLHSVRHIGNIIHYASVFNFRKHSENMKNTDRLPENVSELFLLLNNRQTDYLLVGGIALLQYVEGRNTEDIDLIMALSSVEKLPEISIMGRDADFLRGDFKGLQIDILLTRNPLFDEVIRNYSISKQFAEYHIPCAKVEGLLLLKLYALPSLYRQGNFARVGLYENDIATLIQAYQPNLEPLYKELKKYLSITDFNAIKEIVTEIEQRINRFDKLK